VQPTKGPVEICWTGRHVGFVSSDLLTSHGYYPDLGEVPNVSVGSFSTKLVDPRHVRYSPDRDRIEDSTGGPLCANSGRFSSFIVVLGDVHFGVAMLR